MHAARASYSYPRQQPPKMWSQSLLHIRTLILSLFIAALHKKGILNFVSSVLPCLFLFSWCYYYKKACNKNNDGGISGAFFHLLCPAHFFVLFSGLRERASENRALTLSLPAAQLWQNVTGDFHKQRQPVYLYISGGMRRSHHGRANGLQKGVVFNP